MNIMHDLLFLELAALAAYPNARDLARRNHRPSTGPFTRTKAEPYEAAFQDACGRLREAKLDRQLQRSQLRFAA